MMNISPATAHFFKEALKEVLDVQNFAREDLEEHGRLLEYKANITHLMVHDLP